MIVRIAKAIEIDEIVEMSEARRLQYQEYQATFWRKARDSKLSTREFFLALLNDEKSVFLVAEVENQISGFLIAREIPTPPVYAPGGLTFLIDDFCVLNSTLWWSTGAALLTEISSALKSRGGAQIVVVCGDRDLAKAELLRRTGLTIASNWWTTPLK